MTLVDRYTVGVHKGRFVLLFVWVVLGALGGIYTMKFIKNTTQEFTPPPGSPAAIAQDVMTSLFPSFGEVARFSLFIESRDKKTPILDYVQCEYFLGNLSTHILRLKDPLVQEPGLETYFLLNDLGANVLADNLLSPDRTAMTTALTFSLPFFHKRSRDFGRTFVDLVKDSEDVVKGGDESELPFKVEVAALPVFLVQMESSIEKDMGMMDAIVLPIALAVMGFTVKSVRLIILPCLSIGLTLTVSFGIMYFVTLVTPVNASTPSLIMSLAIAMSIDYNLFLGSRYVEELKNGLRGPAVVSNVLASSGKTILISGTTLMLTFCGLILFPMAVIKNFGYGCAIAILISMLVSLTLTPTLLLMFPNFFERVVIPMKDQWLYQRTLGHCFPNGVPFLCSESKDSKTRATQGNEDFATPTKDPHQNEEYNESSTLLDARQGNLTTGSNTNGNTSGMLFPSVGNGKKVSGLSMHTRQGSTGDSVCSNDGLATGLPLRDGASTDGEGMGGWRKSIFYRLAPVMRYPWNGLVFSFLVLASGAVAYFAMEIKPVDSFYAYLPRGSEGYDAFHGFSQTFGYGYLEPYNVVFEIADDDLPTNVTTPEFFKFSQGLLQALTVNASEAQLPAKDGTTLMSPVSLPNGEWPTYLDFAVCQDIWSIVFCNPNLNLLSSSMITKDKKAMLVVLTTTMEPTGDQGYQQYSGMRDAIATYKKKHGPYADNWNVYVAGNGPASMDMVHSMYQDFPMIVGITAAVVLSIVGIAFRSVFVPLRALISIALTEGFVFGVAVLTYQVGIFDWVGWGSLESHGGITFIAPIVSFTVIVGVALDYDIFLVTRIHEVATEDDVETKEAVLQGVCHTGRIITAAGVVMAIAFFGLVLSQVRCLNELGWFLCVAVLFDTFIVRTFVVPSIMSIIGKWNWWPSKVKADSW